MCSSDLSALDMNLSVAAGGALASCGIGMSRTEDGAFGSILVLRRGEFPLRAAWGSSGAPLGTRGESVRGLADGTVLRPSTGLDLPLLLGRVGSSRARNWGLICLKRIAIASGSRATPTVRASVAGPIRPRACSTLPSKFLPARRKSLKKSLQIGRAHV